MTHAIQSSTKHSVALLSCIVTIATAYPRFKDAIPNGHKVPHPCDSDSKWNGVGHLLSGGGGNRNQFGIDFKLAGEKWTESLCRMDSDGDGLTNGQELGDPNCIWTPEAKFTTAKPLSHPGVCEPIDAPKCEQYNMKFGDSLNCAKSGKACPVLDEPGVQQQDIQFPITDVPEEVTTYHCMMIDLPTDGDYHLVAATPILNNTDIVHHMILFGCAFPAGYDMTKINRYKGLTYQCSMVPHLHCQQFLATWTYGLAVDCGYRDAGLRIGKYGTRIAALQIHYNNPRLLKKETDMSGMTIHYTNKLRENDASVFLTGQDYIMIPPNSTGTTASATCPSECTADMFKEPIYITRVANHMHYLGRSQRISVYRNGTKVRDLTNNINYDYDAPVFYHFDPPVKIMPGDEIRTKCTYASKSDVTVHQGAGTDDEMCYGFLTYYPIQEFINTVCISWKSVQRCVRKLDKFNGYYGACHWKDFEQNIGPMFGKAFLNESCGNYHYNEECNDQCISDSKHILKDPCLQGDLGEFLIGRAGAQQYAKILQKCASFTSSADNLNRTLLYIYLSIVFYVYIVLC